MQIPFRLVEDKLKFSEANICIRNSQDFPSCHTLYFSKQNNNFNDVKGASKYSSR